jgi:hypothetical protein
MSHVIGDATAVQQCCCSTSWPPTSHRCMQQPPRDHARCIGTHAADVVAELGSAIAACTSVT